MKCRFLVSVVLLMVLGAGAAIGKGGNPAADVVVSKCTVCHSADRICNNLQARDASGWKETVNRMRSKGAQLSDEQAAQVAQYLAGLSKGAAPVCK